MIRARGTQTKFAYVIDKFGQAKSIPTHSFTQEIPSSPNRYYLMRHVTLIVTVPASCLLVSPIKN